MASRNSRRPGTQGSLDYASLEPRQLLATVVANYADDFAGLDGQLTPGWQYQWNSPVDGDLRTGQISDANTEFVSMVHTAFRTNWTSDGDLNPSNSTESGYLLLSRAGGHPGTPSQAGSSVVERYSIASFTVSESGFYEIADSFIGLQPVNLEANSNGVEYRVFVNRNEALVEGVVEQGSRNYFDTALGFLRSGDKVQVAFGANGSHAYDYFKTDFSITRDESREQVVGGYRDDFGTQDNASDDSSGWQYLWNAPVGWSQENGLDVNRRSGAIDDPTSFLPLENAGNGFFTADGDLDGRNSSPDSYLRLSSHGGLVGAGYRTPVYHDRFAIAAFTVPNSGLYAINDSFLRVDQLSNDGVELFVQVGDQGLAFESPLVVQGGSQKSFDVELGYLQKGDTVYVGFGANGNHISDYFETDFELIRYLPRSAPDLSLLDHGGDSISVNDGRFGVPGAIPDDNQNDLAGIESALSYAAVNQFSRVEFDPGVYNLSSNGMNDDQNSFLRMVGYHDLVVDGNGSTLIVDDHTRALFLLFNSSNVIFTNFTVDYAERVPASGPEANDLYKPLTFTQGRVSHLDRASNTFTLTVNTDAFVAPDESFQVDNSRGWGYALDPLVDGRLKKATEWHYSTIGVTEGANPGEFTIQVSHSDGLANGDRYVLQRRHNVPVFGFYAGSSNVSVVGVTAYSAPAVFVSSLHSDHVNVIDSHVAVRPDDWSSTPNTQRWKSINADGVHVQSNRTGVWVEDSTFDGLGDDVMNFYTLPLTVYEQINETQLTLGTVHLDKLGSLASSSMQVGDRLTFFDPVWGRIMDEVRVLAVEQVRVADPADPLGAELRLQTVTLDQPVAGVLVGDPTDDSGYRNETTVFNTSLSRSALVQDSVLANSRRYGNFLMAQNVQLLDNVYEGLSDQAIAAHNEPGWPLGPFTSDILIQGNHFVDNGFSRRYLSDEFHSGVVAFQAARYVEGDHSRSETNFRVDDGSIVHHNVQIRDNVFYHWRKSAISIRNSSHVVIEGNSIQASFNDGYGEVSGSPIQVHYTQGVDVESNIFAGDTDAVDVSASEGFTAKDTQYVFNRDMEAWFKFDWGKNLRDSSGNGVVADFTRAGIVDGKFNSAAVFNTSSSITLSGLTHSAIKDQTVSLWFEARDSNTAGKQVLFEQGDQNSGLNIYLEDGQLFAGAWLDGSFTTFLQTAFDASDWNHVALVVDGNSQKLRGYLNGHKFGAGSAQVIPTFANEANLGQAGNGGTRFHSGAAPVAGYGYAGRIDDVKIYSRVLGDGEVAGLAQRF